MPAPDDESAKYQAELIDQLFSAERDMLLEAFGRLRDGSASDDDPEAVRSIYSLAQERLEAGLNIVRERKPPEQWNQEAREALRLQREGGGPWRSISSYNEFLLEVGNLGGD